MEKVLDTKKIEKGLSFLEFFFATEEIDDVYHNWSMEREKSKKLYTAFFSDAFKECGTWYGFPQELFHLRRNTIGQDVYYDLIQSRLDLSYNGGMASDFTFIQNPVCYFNRKDFLSVFSNRAEEDSIVVLGAFGLNSDRDKKFKLSLLSDFGDVCPFPNLIITDSYTQGDYYGAYVASKQKVLTKEKILNLHSSLRR